MAMSVPPLNPFWSDVTMSNGTVITAPPVPDPATIKPTVGDIGKLCSTRTIDDAGNQLGTFSSDTRPTDAEVTALIDVASDETLGQFPANMDAIWWPALTRMIALRAAALVEIGFYREQALAGPGATHLSQYAAELQALKALVPVATYIS
jgi:hypothetical protein